MRLQFIGVTFNSSNSSLCVSVTSCLALQDQTRIDTPRCHETDLS